MSMDFLGHKCQGLRKVENSPIQQARLLMAQPVSGWSCNAHLGGVRRGGHRANCASWEAIESTSSGGTPGVSAKPTARASLHCAMH